MAQSDQVLTANRLRDGEVVYRSGAAWTTELSGADIFADQATANAALAAAADAVRDRLVVNPYLFAIRRDAHGIRPVEEREIIRARGPSVRRDVGKQAGHVPL